jgi:gentisate 1,2-dioxygenase
MTMEQSLTELFNELVSLVTWLDNEYAKPCHIDYKQLRSRLDKIKELKNKVQIESHGNN